VVAMVKAVWSGFSGAPGTSTFYVGTADDTGGDPSSAGLTSAVAAFRQFFNACAGSLAASVTISWDGQGVYLNKVTGAVEGTATYTAPSSVLGTGASSVAAPAGASVRWLTGEVWGSRRLTGRTFLVPLYAGAYEANGTLQATNLSTIQTAAAALVTASTAATTWKFSIQHRPVLGDNGGCSYVIGSSVKDEVAVLTSRRN